jgi:hypothetical protein
MGGFKCQDGVQIFKIWTVAKSEDLDSRIVDGLA